MDRYYRVYVGAPEKYDLVGAMQFNLLTFLGLKEYHFLLDIGCGSLRGGRLFIPYLLPGRYFAVEPNQWLVADGIRNELGKDLAAIKRPTFNNDSSFTLSVFDRKFDFILAQSIFTHASQSQIRRCLSEAKKVMKPTSIFAATFLKGERNYTGPEWDYSTSITYTLECISGLVEEQDLICKSVDWPHPDSQTWVVITEPDNARNIPDLSDIANLSSLANELKLCKEKLARVEGHPYVKFGRMTNRLIREIGRWVGLRGVLERYGHSGSAPNKHA